jgi:hypothetical protein
MFIVSVPQRHQHEIHHDQPQPEQAKVTNPRPRIARWWWSFRALAPHQLATFRNDCNIAYWSQTIATDLRARVTPVYKLFRESIRHMPRVAT